MTRADHEQNLLLAHQTHLVMDTSRPFSETLRKRGVVRVDEGLSSSTALKLQSFIDATLESALIEVNSFKAPRNYWFGNVLEKSNRWDLLLPFNKDHQDSVIVRQALAELLGEQGAIGRIIDEILGEEAVLYELACMISDPGSQRQEIHPDIMYSKDDIPLIACFISLQDIDSSMGPTVFIPDTVTEDAHRKINSIHLADEMLQSIPSCISTLGIGDCSLYNPMVLHAGGGNVSKQRRRLFYFTFLDPSIEDPSVDFNPGSINPILKMKKLTLKKVREQISMV